MESQHMQMKRAACVVFMGMISNIDMISKVEADTVNESLEVLKRIEHDPEFGFTFDLSDDLKNIRADLLNSTTLYRDATTASEPIAARRSMADSASEFQWSPSFLNNSTMNVKNNNSTMNMTNNNTTMNNATIDAAGDIYVDAEVVDTTVTPTNVPAPTIADDDIYMQDIEIDMVPSDFTINGNVNITAPPADHLQFTQTTTPYPTARTMINTSSLNGTYAFPREEDVDMPKGTRDMHSMENVSDIIEDLLYRGTQTQAPRNATMVHDFGDVSAFNINNRVNVSSDNVSNSNFCDVDTCNQSSDSDSEESNPIRDLLHEEKHRLVEEHPSTRSTIFDIECVGCNFNIMVIFLSAAVLLSSCISKDNLIRGQISSTSRISK